MLERTMKPFGATAVFLAVLLTVSSRNINEANAQSSQAPENQDSSTASPSTPLISNSLTEQAKYESSPKPSTSPSENPASTSTSRSPTISTVSTPTVEIPSVQTSRPSTDLNKDLNDSTVASDKVSTVPPEKKDQSVDAETTTPCTQAPREEETTRPSVEPQKPAKNGKVPSKEDSTKSSIETQKKASKHGEDSKDHETDGSRGDAKQISATSNKGMKIGVGCVAAVIAVIILVVIYKMCQKKPPAAENPEVKESAETKENVKLLSVKTETPNSDMKRTSSNQVECIEC